MLICNPDIILPSGTHQHNLTCIFLFLPFLVMAMLPRVNLWCTVLTRLSFLQDQFSPLEPYMWLWKEQLHITLQNRENTVSKKALIHKVQG